MGKTYRYRPDEDGYSSKKNKTKKRGHSNNKKTHGMKPADGYGYEDNSDYEYGPYDDHDKYRQ